MSYDYDPNTMKGKPTGQRGGTRPGAGRPAGTKSDNTRSVQLTQRYTPVEEAAIARAAVHGVGDFIRSAVLRALADRKTCPHSEGWQRHAEVREFAGGPYRLHTCQTCGAPDWRPEVPLSDRHCSNCGGRAGATTICPVNNCLFPGWCLDWRAEEAANTCKHDFADMSGQGGPEKCCRLCGKVAE